MKRRDNIFLDLVCAKTFAFKLPRSWGTAALSGSDTFSSKGAEYVQGDFVVMIPWHSERNVRMSLSFLSKARRPVNSCCVQQLLLQAWRVWRWQCQRNPQTQWLLLLPRRQQVCNLQTMDSQRHFSEMLRVTIHIGWTVFATASFFVRNRPQLPATICHRLRGRDLCAQWEISRHVIWRGVLRNALQMQSLRVVFWSQNQVCKAGAMDSYTCCKKMVFLRGSEGRGEVAFWVANAAHAWQRLREGVRAHRGGLYIASCRTWCDSCSGEVLCMAATWSVLQERLPKSLPKSGTVPQECQSVPQECLISVFVAQECPRRVFDNGVSR